MEEVENPKRNMPLAIIIAMSLIALFYLALNVSYFAILTPQQVKTSSAVAIDFANGSLGDFKYCIPFFIAVLLIGSLNSTMFSASRFLYAASREGHLPGFISCVNKFHDSPRAALLIHVLLAMMFSFAGNLDTLIQYVSFAQWFQRMITMLALMWIRFRHINVHPDAIKTPIVLPIFFFFVCTALTGVTIWESPTTAGVALGLIAGGLIVYIIFIWSKTLNRFEWYRKVAAKINNKTSIFTQIIFNGLIDQYLVDDHDPASGLLHDKEIIAQKICEKTETTKRNGFINKALDISSESSLSYRGNSNNEKVKPSPL
jgi:amino acid transporter